MNAICYERFGGPEVMRLTEMSEPEFDDDDVLIDVVSASVTPGDCMLRDGQLQDLFPITFPKIPGRDGAGIVRAVGGNVGGFTSGDRVCFVARRTEQGSNAERIARPADDVIRMPDGLEFTDAAALLHAGACAWIALVESAEIQPGMHVLIHGGSGAIGGMAVQIASHLGARVSATCRAVNSDYVLGLGADAVIAYDQTDFAEVVCDVDVVLDLVGGDVHDRSCRALRPGGVLVFLIAEPFEDRSLEYGIELRQAVIEDDKLVLEKVVALAAEGTITPQVSRVMTLSDAADAHRLIESGQKSRGRIVLFIP
jgi:NADPH:quinone reductase-like Zn-dependent oxidoreductase